jgi:hypothetical protein
MAEQLVRCLAKARDAKDLMEIDICVMRDYYVTLSTHAGELFWQITLHQLFKSTIAEEDVT